MRPEERTRASWVRERMRTTMRRYDELHSTHYDCDWGDVDETHRRFVTRVARLCPRGSTVLDSACGTGKYFGLILSLGRRVVGFDQSRGMLHRARAKHPDVPLVARRLEELAVRQPFAGTMCVDAMEFVPPEAWARVVQGLRDATAPGGPVYLTVEGTNPEALEAAERAGRASGAPIVRGEDAAEAGYHYYPDRERVRAWLRDAGLAIVEEADDVPAEGEGYWHLLCRAPP